LFTALTTTNGQSGELFHDRVLGSGRSQPVNGNEIFRVIDDRSRLLLASRVTRGETSADAWAVMLTAFAADGLNREAAPQCELAVDPACAVGMERLGMTSRLTSMSQAWRIARSEGEPDCGRRSS
jgi:hypothetical protein